MIRIWGYNAYARPQALPYVSAPVPAPFSNRVSSIGGLQSALRCSNRVDAWEHQKNTSYGRIPAYEKPGVGRVATRRLTGIGGLQSALRC